MLSLVENFSNLDAFRQFLETKLFGQTTFHVCAAFKSMIGTEFVIFSPSEGDGPEAAARAVAALTVALKADQVFIGYAANLEPIFGSKFGDLGSHQAIFFVADAKQSHPYEFCKLISLNQEWKIGIIAKLTEKDDNGQIFMSDLYQYIANQSDEDTRLARKSIEEWRPDLSWDWNLYDKKF